MKLAIKFTAILASLAFLLIPNLHAAQKSVKLTTYYPAPYGEYKRLNSTEDAYLATTSGNVGIGTTNPQAKLDVTSTDSGFLPPRMSTIERDAIASVAQGTVIFNTDATVSALQIYDGSRWKSLASQMVLSGHGEITNTCDGAIMGNGLCNGRFYKVITFSSPFSSPPHVLVTPERVSEAPACAGSVTDTLAAYPEDITTTGFKLYAFGSPGLINSCGVGSEGYSTQARAGWMAIGD